MYEFCATSRLVREMLSQEHVGIALPTQHSMTRSRVSLAQLTSGGSSSVFNVSLSSAGREQVIAYLISSSVLWPWAGRDLRPEDHCRGPHGLTLLNVMEVRVQAVQRSHNSFPIWITLVVHLHHGLCGFLRFLCETRYLQYLNTLAEDRSTPSTQSRSCKSSPESQCSSS